VEWRVQVLDPDYQTSFLSSPDNLKEIYTFEWICLNLTCNFFSAPSFGFSYFCLSQKKKERKPKKFFKQTHPAIFPPSRTLPLTSSIRKDSGPPALLLGSLFTRIKQLFLPRRRFKRQLSLCSPPLRPAPSRVSTHR